jgi:Na+-driven multidrug efflux pump
MTSAGSTNHSNIASSSGGEAVGLAERQAVTAPAVPYLKLLLFYLPLAFSGFMITLDVPVVNAVLNRLPDPDTSVAALRVAFSLALVYEACHVSIIDVSTAMSSDRRVFAMLGRFYMVMAAVLLVVASIIVVSPIYDWIVQGLMNIPASVAEAARPASLVFLLWPIPIGWRRLCQGALIRSGESKPVGAGGLVRMGSLAVALIFFGWFGTSVVPIEPAAIAVLAMLVSVTGEALAVQRWTNRVLRKLPDTAADSPAPTYRDVWRYFFPLGATSIMSTLMQPILTAGIASVAIIWASPSGPVVAVAAYAIAWSLASPVFGPTFSMTQASIAWRKSPDASVRERGPRVLVGFGVGLAALMAVISLTPIVNWLFTVPLGAPPDTASLAADVTRWLIPVPVLYAISFMLRGRLIAMGRPTAVRRAQLVDLAAIFAIVLAAASGLFAPLLQGAPAAPFAALAFDLMLCVDIAILSLSLRALGGGRNRNE